MKKCIAILILLSFATPVHAGMVTDFERVEKNLIDKKQLETDMTNDFKKQQEIEQTQPVKTETKSESSGSNWWKWALGIAAVGAVAAAAGGGGGGGSSSGTSGTGSTTVTW